jgi:erythromycin esterase-like protein
MIDELAFNALQNTTIALNAERYYATALMNDTESWNVRDRHMVETINELRYHHGNNAKVIVWAHNTHVGDARATNMKDQGMVNVGQLLREQHGEENVYIVGLGTYTDA